MRLRPTSRQLDYLRSLHVPDAYLKPPAGFEDAFVPRPGRVFPFPRVLAPLRRFWPWGLAIVLGLFGTLVAAEPPDAVQPDAIEKTEPETVEEDDAANADESHPLADQLREQLDAVNENLRAIGNVEQDHWLAPIDDRRRRDDGAREGMLEGFTLGNYLLVVDYTSRLCRNGKARLSADVAGIFERLGTSAEFWEQRLKKLFARSRLLGSYFATDRQRLRQVAERRGVHHLDNLVAVSSAGS